MFKFSGDGRYRKGMITAAKKKVVKFPEEFRFLVEDGELKKRNAARSRDCSFREEEAILVAAQMLLKTEWCFSIS
jgi:hypothetical protein